MMPRLTFAARHPILLPRLHLGMRMLVMLSCMALPGMAAAQSNVQVLLKNGDHILGKLVPSSGPALISIQCDRFSKPLDFQIDAIGSIDSKEDTLANVQGQMQFVLNNHATIIGTLLELNDQRVRVKSRSLGELAFPRALLNEICAEGERGKSLFSGPRAGQNWKSGPKESAWSMEGGSLVNAQPGQVLRCDASLGGQREVRIALSWLKTPNFVVSLGTANEVTDPAKVQEPTMLSLETWGSTLVMVRSTGKAVDFAPIGQVTEDSRRLDLVLYIDEKKFEVVACSPAGKVLGRLSDNAKANDSRRPMIKLLNANNKGGTLRLERLIVREWNGRLPSQTNAVGEGIACIDEQFYQGTVKEFNATEQTFSSQALIQRPRVYR